MHRLEGLGRNETPSVNNQHNAPFLTVLVYVILKSPPQFTEGQHFSFWTLQIQPHPTHTHTHTHKYCDVRIIHLQDRPRFWIVISCSVCVTAWSSTLCTVPGREEGCPTGLPEALSAWDHWPRADGGAAKEKWEGRDGSSKILLHLEDAEIMDQLFFLPLSSVLKGRKQW